MGSAITVATRRAIAMAIEMIVLRNILVLLSVRYICRPICTQNQMENLSKKVIYFLITFFRYFYFYYPSLRKLKKKTFILVHIAPDKTITLNLG